MSSSLNSKVISIIWALLLHFAVSGPSLGNTIQEKDGFSLLRESPQSKRFVEFVQAVCDPDNQKWTNLIESRMSDELKNKYSKDNWASLKRQMNMFWKRLRFVGQASDLKTRVSLVGKDPKEPLQWWFEYVVEFDSENPDLIVDFNVQLSGPPDVVLNDKLTEDEIRKELSQFLAQLESQNIYSGAVLLANRTDVLVESVAGYASLEYGAPNNIGTRFCLGSLTKLFTAVGIMKLVDEDKISLDDSVSDYLDQSWVSKELGRRIKIKHLLSHTAGIGNFFEHPDYSSTRRTHFVDVESFNKFINITKTEFPPGTGYRYSNSGYVLLGAIIEKVSSVDYHDFMRAEVYGPAEMKDTDCYYTNRTIPNIAQGYYKNGQGQILNNFLNQRLRGCPAGSSYSTIRDLHSFANQFQSGRLISNDAFVQMTSPKVELGAPDYGFGIQLFRLPNAMRAFGHSGGGPGVHARLTIYEDSGFIAVVLTNNHRMTGRAIEAKIDELMIRLKK